VAAVAVLEDHGEFNAGRGSALTALGTVEMDAAVAEGESGRAGAVAAVQGVRSPVRAARAVMDDGRHVLLAGPAAAEFARAAGLAFEPEEWFVTRRRQKELARETAGGSPGTVGAVALDRHGHLAAATSTGGRPGQVPGRVGDTPVLGAGTWACDATCAISATGDGEAFLRAAFAHEVDARLRLGGCNLDSACQRALEIVARLGGTGGCIALDRSGWLAMPFTAAVMDRGLLDRDGIPRLGYGPGPLSPYPVR
jgi:beta-aspartyl-peptidase (threonine type)